MDPTELTHDEQQRILQGIRPELVAIQFCKDVMACLDRPEQMFSIRQKLKDPRYANACPVQDYMDANMVMHAAMCTVAGFEVEVVCDEPGSDAMQTLWNEAWEIARAARYSQWTVASRYGIALDLPPDEQADRGEDLP